MVPTVQLESDKAEFSKNVIDNESAKMVSGDVNDGGSNHVSSDLVGNGMTSQKTEKSKPSTEPVKELSESKDKSPTVKVVDEKSKPSIGETSDKANKDVHKPEDENQKSIKNSASDEKIDEPKSSSISEKFEDVKKDSNNESVDSQETPQKLQKTPKQKKLKETPERVSESQEQTRSGRVRKQISRLSTEMDQVFKKKEREIARKPSVFSAGRGIPLGEIESISEAIKKSKADESKFLHRILFNRSGKQHEMRSNLRKFNGFDFSEDSDGYSKKIFWLTSQKALDLKSTLKILCLEVSGSREEMANRLMSFLLKPNIDAPKKIRKSKSKETQKSKKSLNKKKSGDGSKSTVLNDDSSSDGSGSDDNEQTKPTPVKRKSEDTRGNAAKKPRKSSGNDMDDIFASVLGRAESDDDKSDSEDEESGQKSSDEKKHPTDSDLKQAVADCLKDADLESVTMKTVCQQVFDMYPDFDLSHKRELIKKTVKQVLSST